MLTLAAAYERVIILCVGTTATKSVLGLTLHKAMRRQNETVTLADSVGGLATFKVFSTWHPAALLRRREPSLVDSVCDHLLLLRDYMEDGIEWKIPEVGVVPIASPPVDYPLEVLSLDIETYGCRSNLPAQRHFHPRKSETLDGVEKRDLIRTIGLGWRDPEGNLHSTVFLPSKNQHMLIFWQWMRKCREEGIPVLGMNIRFDLMYLRYVFPWARSVYLNDELRVRDISVINYLHNELRPERSLKDLSRLFGVTPYDTTLKDRLYESDEDPILHAYNIEDCYAAILLWELLARRIERDYPDTNKLSEYAENWYSQAIWTSIYLGEDGVAVDVEKMRALLESYSQDIFELTQLYNTLFGEPLCGKGSQPVREQMVIEARDLIGISPMSSELEYSEKTGKLSCNKHNIKVLLPRLPSSPVRTKLEFLSEFRRLEKLVGTYLRPRLEDTGNGCVNLNSILYPSWYPVPGYQKDEEGDEGGTIQCRMTCKGPAVQTDPKAIKACITTRFDPGFLLISDLSQIELRIAGLLANEPEFISEYNKASPDLHSATAAVLFGDAKAVEYLYRQAGKKTNFLMLFRGKAKKLHESIMNDLGLDIPIDVCEDLIIAFYKKYRRLGEWQEELIERAIRTGYIEVPLVGASRLFRGAPSVVAATYINTICNLPVQATAANVMISAQGAVIREFHRRQMKSLCSSQIYDSLFIEGPLYELETAKCVAESLIQNSPFFVELCEHLGRSIRVTADTNIFIRKEGVLTRCDEQYKIHEPVPGTVSGP